MHCKWPKYYLLFGPLALYPIAVLFLKSRKYPLSYGKSNLKCINPFRRSPMRRERLIICMLALFLLSACSSNNADTMQPDSVYQNNISESVGTSDSTENPEKEIDNSYNMILPCEENVYGSGNDSGFYRIRKNSDGSRNILFTDYATAQEVILCSNPNCTHNVESCTSYIPATNGQIWVAATDENIFVIYSSWYGESKIEIADLDGTNRNVIYTFKSGCSPRPGLAASKESIVFLEEELSENDSATTQAQSLVEVNTSTGEQRVLYNNIIHSDGSTPVATESDFFLGIDASGFILKKIIAGDLPENQTHTVYRLPYGSQKLEKIISYNYGEMQTAPFHDGIAYLKNNNAEYEFGYIDSKTGETHIVCSDLKGITSPYSFSDIFIRRFLGDWAIFNVMQDVRIAENNDIELTYGCYAVNMITSEIKELKLSNHYNATYIPVEVYAQFDNRLLVAADVTESKNPDGGMNILKTSLGIISMEDYLSSVDKYTFIAMQQ